MQNVHLEIETESCHASFYPGSVQAIEGLLKVKEEHDAGLLTLRQVADILKIGKRVVINPAIGKEAGLCGVHNVIHHWPESAGERACGDLVVRVQQRDGPVAG